MLVSMILDAYRRLTARRMLVRELDQLTDEDLADIGLVRSQVRDFAEGKVERLRCRNRPMG